MTPLDLTLTGAEVLLPAGGLSRSELTFAEGRVQPGRQRMAGS